MAKQFSYHQQGQDISVWAETEEQTIEEAKDELADRDFDLDEDEIRDNIRVIPSPRRIKSSAEDVLMDMRRRGGMEAAEVVEDGMDVGLGTGSTTAWAIAKIGWKIDEGTLHERSRRRNVASVPRTGEGSRTFRSSTWTK